MFEIFFLKGHPFEFCSMARTGWQIFLPLCLAAAIGISGTVSNFGLKFAPDLIHRVVLEDDWGRSLIWGVTMGTAHLAHDQHDRRATGTITEIAAEDCRLRDDEHADDVLSLLEENARLRGLVVKLSNLILRNVADQR